MGCHTWFYKPSKYSLNDIKQKWIAEKKRFIQVFSDDMKLDDRENDAMFADLSLEQCEFYLKVYERQLRMVVNGNIKHAFVTDYTDNSASEVIYRFEKGEVWACTKDMPHDIFRVDNYPGDKLFSMKSTLEFCAKIGLVLSDKQIASLNDFWNKYPIGMIEFG